MTALIGFKSGAVITIPIKTSVADFVKGVIVDTIAKCPNSDVHWYVDNGYCFNVSQIEYIRPGENQ